MVNVKGFRHYEGQILWEIEDNDGRKAIISNRQLKDIVSMMLDMAFPDDEWEINFKVR